MTAEREQSQEQQQLQGSCDGTGTMLLTSPAMTGELSWQEEMVAAAAAGALHDTAAAADAAAQQLLTVHHLLPPPAAEMPADTIAQASATAAASVPGGDASLQLQALELLPPDVIFKPQPLQVLIKAFGASKHLLCQYVLGVRLHTNVSKTCIFRHIVKNVGCTTMTFRALALSAFALTTLPSLLHQDGTARRIPEVPEAKLCPACHRWKSSADFLRISKNADGLAHKCKSCAMKAADGPTLAEKACSKCKEIKPKSQFCINKYMQDGMQVGELMFSLLQLMPIAAAQM